jgi:hypothetical protein
MSDGGTAWARGISPDKTNAERDHFYPTPPEGTRALLSVESFNGDIWEPACGDGAISRELEAAGYSVTSTDLIDRGYGTPGVDFLLDYQTVCPNIVTNPPFKLAGEFARHALARSTRKVCMLARLAWLEGKSRGEFFQSSPLARVWVFSSRLNMQRARQAEKADAGGMIAFAWFVWEHGHQGQPHIGWLPNLRYDGQDDSRKSWELGIAEMRRRHEAAK